MISSFFRTTHWTCTSTRLSWFEGEAACTVRRLRWVCVLAMAAGCVFFDGKAMTDAEVLFMPTTLGPAASGNTDADGLFRLQTGSQYGALVGNHRVVFSRAETRGISADADGLSGAISDGGWQLIEYLPTRYAQPDTSGLTAVSSRTPTMNSHLN